MMSLFLMIGSFRFHLTSDFLVYPHIAQFSLARRAYF